MTWKLSKDVNILITIVSIFILTQELRFRKLCNKIAINSLKDVAFYLFWGQFAVKHGRGSLRLAPPNHPRQLHAAKEKLPSLTCPPQGTLTAVTCYSFWDPSGLRCVARDSLPTHRGFWHQMPTPSRVEHKKHHILPPNPQRRARIDSERLAWLQNRWLTSVRNT